MIAYTFLVFYIIHILSIRMFLDINVCLLQFKSLTDGVCNVIVIQFHLIIMHAELVIT